MTGPEVFRAAAAELLEAARAGDPNLSVLVRQAMRELARYDLPIGLKVEDAWIGVMPKKLEGVNRWMSDWRIRSNLRKRWGTLLRLIVCAGERVASYAGLVELGRAPSCSVKMAVQVVRLVPSVREFLKDDDSLASCPKQLYDAMKDQKLIREDRREWLRMLPPVQDVSPIAGTAVTLFLLWQEEELDVHRSVRTPARQEGHAHDRGAEEGRTVPRVRRRAGPRAVDV